MGFYDISENVDKYIEMCNEYNGNHIYLELTKFLEENISILELGSGPGLDITFLTSHYHVTGSDLSNEFLSRLRTKFPEIPFLKINALDIDVNNKFDCIYSNKVLHHLTKEELSLSLSNQSKVLNRNGLIAHTFWIGEKNQEMEGLLFTYYRRQEIVDIISENYKILSTISYTEFEESDSLLIIAKRF